jgi:hypothetical protein
MKLRRVEESTFRIVKKFLLFSRTELPTFSCAHTIQSLDLFVKEVNKTRLIERGKRNTKEKLNTYVFVEFPYMY